MDTKGGGKRRGGGNDNGEVTIKTKWNTNTAAVGLWHVRAGADSELPRTNCRTYELLYKCQIEKGNVSGGLNATKRDLRFKELKQN